MLFSYFGKLHVWILQTVVKQTVLKNFSNNLDFRLPIYLVTDKFWPFEMFKYIFLSWSTCIIVIRISISIGLLKIVSFLILKIAMLYSLFVKINYIRKDNTTGESDFDLSTTFRLTLSKQYDLFFEFFKEEGVTAGINTNKKKSKRSTQCLSWYQFTYITPVLYPLRWCILLYVDQLDWYRPCFFLLNYNIVSWEIFVSAVNLHSRIFSSEITKGSLYPENM